MKSEIDIEETLKYSKYGIVCFNENGRKLYYRPRKLSPEERKEYVGNFEYELVPVSKAEKQNLGIEESELQESDGEIEIEESEHTETEEEKKKTLTLKGSPETVQSAKAILEKEMAKKTDNDLATLKLKMYEKFNHNAMFLDAPDKNTLEAMVENYVNTAIEKDKGRTPAGSPLVQAQYGTPKETLYTKKYESWKAMVDDLQTRKRGGSREAASYLDDLERLMLRSMKTNPNQPVPSYDPNDIENLPNLKNEGNFRVPLHREEGDLGKLVERWANENPRRKRAKEQIEAGRNPEERE